MLDDFGIVGVSWRQDGSEALARYALPEDDQAERLRSFRDAHGLREIAYLETCNRVEVIFLRENAGVRTGARDSAGVRDGSAATTRICVPRSTPCSRAARRGPARRSASSRRGAAKAPASISSSSPPASTPPPSARRRSSARCAAAATSRMRPA